MRSISMEEFCRVVYRTALKEKSSIVTGVGTVYRDGQCYYEVSYKVNEQDKRVLIPSKV